MNNAETKNKSEGFSGGLMPVAQMALDFINLKPFIRNKVVKGKAKCDKCGNVFPALTSHFVIIDESNEELLCYPCNHIRLGIDIKEVYAKKRSSGELELLRLQNQKNNQKPEKVKKTKEVKVKKAEVIKAPDLFSNL